MVLGAWKTSALSEIPHVSSP